MDKMGIGRLWSIIIIFIIVILVILSIFFSQKFFSEESSPETTYCSDAVVGTAIESVCKNQDKLQVKIVYSEDIGHLADELAFVLEDGRQVNKTSDRTWPIEHFLLDLNGNVGDMLKMSVRTGDRWCGVADSMKIVLC